MTNQEIFNYVWNWFLVEKNPPAFNPDMQCPRCVYRTEDGKKCAVGCLIPDEFYNIEFEMGGSVMGNFLVKNTLSKVIGEYDKDFLPWLQSAHDGILYEDTFERDFKVEMYKIAEKWNLEVPSD